MFGNVFLKTLRDQRKGLVGWSIGLVLLVLLESAIWPTVRNMANFEEFLASYPDAFAELFNLEDFVTGNGFLNAELFSMVMPILFLVYGIARGAKSVAGEEQNGTLEVLLTTRVSPISLVLHRAAALAVAILALGAVLFVSVLVCSPLFDLGVGAGDAAAGSLAMVLLGLEFGWLALAVSAATGRRLFATAVAAAAAVAMYVLYAAGLLVEAVEPWKVISPFDQALSSGPLGGGIPLAFLWMLLAGAIFVLAALPVFDRRDITVH